VVAAAGLAAGAVGPGVFSAAILMTLVTTILTPLALKAVYVTSTAARGVLSEPVEDTRSGAAALESVGIEG
jgi:Kef-type K+ transport system membrane component KefB